MLLSYHIVSAIALRW